MSKSTLFSEIKFDEIPFSWHNNKLSEPNFEGYYHWHQGCELLIVFSGEGQVIVNQHTYRLKNGTIFFFQPFQLHKVSPNNSSSIQYQRATFHFDPVFAKNCLSKFSTLSTFFKEMKEGLLMNQSFDFSEDLNFIYNLCCQFDKMTKDNLLSFKEELGQLLFIQLLAYVQFHFKDRDSISHLRRKPHYSEEVMNWIEDHLDHSFDLNQLACDLHLSKSYVSKIFKIETGSSITDYLTARRIKHACHLLQMTDHTLQHVAEQIGLLNVSYFIQLFKKETGITPHQYRIKSIYFSP